MPRFVVWTFVSLTRILFVLFTSGRLVVQLQQAPTAPAQSSQLQLKIGDATITPAGFMDRTNTWRSRNVGTSLQTNFAAIPYGISPEGRVIEDNFTAAISRVGLRVDTKVQDVTFSPLGE